MTMRSVEVETVSQADEIPAHMLALMHGHHRHIAEKIAVHGRTNIRRNEPTSDDGKIAVSIRRAVFELVHGLRLGGVSLDVMVQIPTVVFVDDEERSHKLAVNILGSSIGAGHTFTGDDNRADESGVGIVTFEVVGMIEPDNGTGIVGSWSGALRHFPDIGVGSTGRYDSVMRWIIGAVVVVGTF